MEEKEARSLAAQSWQTQRAKIGWVISVGL